MIGIALMGAGRMARTHARGGPAYGTTGEAGPSNFAGCYMLSPESGVMTGSLVDYDQNVAGACPE
jgi:hypothetical protein